MLGTGLSNYPALFSSASLAAASITEHSNSSGELYQILAKTNSVCYFKAIYDIYVISKEITYRGFFS